MSWHIKVCGTKSEVTAVIDEAVANPHGMPKTVGDYLKDAVGAVDLTDGRKDDSTETHVVLVESNGHRPMGSGSDEKCAVSKIRRAPWKIER